MQCSGFHGMATVSKNRHDCMQHRQVRYFHFVAQQVLQVVLSHQQRSASPRAVRSSSFKQRFHRTEDMSTRGEMVGWPMKSARMLTAILVVLELSPQSLSQPKRPKAGNSHGYSHCPAQHGSPVFLLLHVQVRKYSVVLHTSDLLQNQEICSNQPSNHPPTSYRPKH